MGINIENPSQPHHIAGYEIWLRECGNGMRYFYEKVLPECNRGVVSLPYLDGKFGAGVASEVVFAIKNNLPAYIIRIKSLFTMRIDDFNPKEIKLLLKWEEKRTKAGEKGEDIGNDLILSINETRERTWLDKRKTMIRSYEVAHFTC